MAGAILAYVLVVKHRIQTRALVLAIGCLLVVGSRELVPEAVAHRFDLEEVRGADHEVNSVALRGTALSEAWQLFTKNPGAGIGVGNFTLHSSDRQIYPHNLLLEVLAEMGLVGFLFFGPLLGIAVMRAYRLFRMRVADPSAQALAMLMVLVLVESNISGDLQGSSSWWLVLGAATASGRLWRVVPSHSPVQAGRVGLPAPAVFPQN